MHEISVAQRMLGIASTAADANGGGRITAMRLVIGALSGVEPETLRFAFEIAARGTRAEGCALELELVPLRLLCRECQIEEDRDLLDGCSGCGAIGGSVSRGRELKVDTIDLDNDAPLDSAGAAQGSET